MNRRVAILLVVLQGLLLSRTSQAQAGTNVVISFTTTNFTALNVGFAGFTTELLGKGEEYGDTNMQHFAAMLSPGWLLFPAGTTGDAFNWQTGYTDTNWVKVIGLRENPGNSASNLTAGTVLALEGKGGVWFTNFASLADNVGGARIIVCINGFTDTNFDSAGKFAAFALSNHIQVAAWELCNEPYLFQGTNDFFTNGLDYANKMLPIRNAIKAADSNAVVAVFFSDPSRSGMAWNNALAAYGATNQYWDAVVYHYYPQLPIGAPFTDLMAWDNGVLFSNSTLYVTNVLMQKSGSNTTFLLTEFGPTLGNGDGTENPPTSTLYGGIYAAEMVMRLSTCPRMSFAGSYQLVNGAGVDTTNDFWNAVTKAASNNYVTNTIGLPFGYFLSAQGSAEAVAYWAINRSTGVYPTMVGANGPTVPMDTNGTPTMPAVYAQAYQGGNGRRYVLLTNKGSNAVPVLVEQDNAVLTNQLLETWVTGDDPAAVNSNPPSNNVVIQSMTATNPVTIPEYSVVRLEWEVSVVPPPLLATAVAGGAQNLAWNGLTNVIYNVQATTNLLANWTTLGRVAQTQTNFGFTNWSSTPQQFYRLAVP
ncbi:MAG TPA: hypothetical protein VL970_06495 [Candidatus Acidoferrales bacterium]|nr:hypothetical protein [Candidatus Acidoferrales bacterium]